MTTARPLRSAEEFQSWFAAQQQQGQGYVEVEDPESGYPCLTFSFREGFGVVHWFPSPDRVLLLVGNDVVDEGDAVDLPVQEDLCPFTGRFVWDVHRARRIAVGVLRAGSTDGLGLWESS